MQSSKEYQGDKKALLSDQCIEIEENNRTEKTRDLFKKIKDTKGTFNAKMGTIKDQNDVVSSLHLLLSNILEKILCWLFHCLNKFAANFVRQASQQSFGCL